MLICLLIPEIIHSQSIFELNLFSFEHLLILSGLYIFDVQIMTKDF